MQGLDFAGYAELVAKPSRKVDPLFEQKRLIESEMLQLINATVKAPYKPLQPVLFRIKMVDAGYKTVESWYQLLSEMKQSKNPGATFGWKVKIK